MPDAKARIAALLLSIALCAIVVLGNLLATPEPTVSPFIDDNPIDWPAHRDAQKREQAQLAGELIGRIYCLRAYSNAVAHERRRDVARAGAPVIVVGKGEGP